MTFKRSLDSGLYNIGSSEHQATANHRTLVLGDSHGNLEGLLQTLQQANVGVLNKTITPSTNLGIIHLGDITTDRFPYGLDILETLAQSRCLTALLAGNHDARTIEFLTGLQISEANKQAEFPADIAKLLTQIGIADKIIGIRELFEDLLPEEAEIAFGPNPKNTPERARAVEKIISLDRQVVLDHLQEARPLALETITRFQLCHLDGPNLYMHVDPRSNILDQLLESGRDIRKVAREINQTFQAFLVSVLLERRDFSRIIREEIERLGNIFLSTRPRKTFYKTGKRKSKSDTLIQLHEQGIKRIVHGHSFRKIPVKMIVLDDDPTVNLTIFSIDRGFGKTTKPDHNDLNQVSAISIQDDYITTHFSDPHVKVVTI